MKGFTFSKPGCKKGGEYVTCYMLVTSNDTDKELTFCANYLNGTSRIIDNFGNSFTSSYAYIGDQGDYSALSGTFPAGIPMKAMLSVKGMPEEATSASLAFVFRSNDQNFIIKFQNVPLSK